MSNNNKIRSERMETQLVEEVRAVDMREWKNGTWS